MKRLRVALTFLLLLSIMSCDIFSSGDVGKSRLTLISYGAGYENLELSKLPACLYDIADIHSAFKARAAQSGMSFRGTMISDKSTGVTGDDDFTVTVSQDFTKDDFKKTIEGFKESSSEDDLTVFYYSGHGLGIDDTYYYGSLILCPPSTATVLDNYLVTSSDLVEMLTGFKGEVLVLLDSCYSGVFITDSIYGDDDSPDAVSRFFSGVDGDDSNLWFITASTEEETSLAGKTNSLFTACLLPSIKGSGTLTYSELYERTKARVDNVESSTQTTSVRPSLKDLIIFGK